MCTCTNTHTRLSLQHACRHACCCHFTSRDFWRSNKFVEVLLSLSRTVQRCFNIKLQCSNVPAIRQAHFSDGALLSYPPSSALKVWRLNCRFCKCHESCPSTFVRHALTHTRTQNARARTHIYLLQFNAHLARLRQPATQPVARMEQCAQPGHLPRVRVQRGRAINATQARHVEQSQQGGRHHQQYHRQHDQFGGGRQVLEQLNGGH